MTSRRDQVVMLVVQVVGLVKYKHVMGYKGIIDLSRLDTIAPELFHWFFFFQLYCSIHSVLYNIMESRGYTESLFAGTNFILFLSIPGIPGWTYCKGVCHPVIHSWRRTCCRTGLLSGSGCRHHPIRCLHSKFKEDKTKQNVFFAYTSS